MSVEHGRNPTSSVELSLNDRKYKSVHQFLNDALPGIYGKIEVIDTHDRTFLFEPEKTRFFPDGVVCFGGEYDYDTYRAFTRGESPAYIAYITALIGNHVIKMPFVTKEQRERKK